MTLRGTALCFFSLLLTAACSTIDSSRAPSAPVASAAPATFQTDQVPTLRLSSGTAPLSFTAGQPEGVEIPRGFASLLRSDVLHLATAPLGWDRSQWAKAGAATALVGGVILFDESIRYDIGRNSNSTTQKIAGKVGPLGAEYSWGVLGGFYLAGKYLHNEKARAVAQEGLISSLIAAGAITPLLKSTIGRSRPSQTEGTFVAGNGGASFPSGHTTQAFAIASVIASHYDSRVVKTVAYGLAGAVGWARMENNAHYGSDVVAGALIGTLVGRTVVRLHEDERFSFEASPSLDASRPGMALTLRTSSSELLGLIRKTR